MGKSNDPAQPIRLSFIDLDYKKNQHNDQNATLSASRGLEGNQTSILAETERVVPGCSSWFRLSRSGLMYTLHECRGTRCVAAALQHGQGEGKYGT